MGLLNKLMFWKKEDEFDFDKLAEKELQEPPSDDMGLSKPFPGTNEKSFFPEEHPAEPMQQPAASLFRSAPTPAPRSFQPAPEMSQSRELELISSKLDTLKAMLNSMEQRMANLEKSSGVQKQRLW